MHWEDRFRRLAAVQAGLIGRDQLPHLGCDCHQWWRARRNGRWRALTDRVLLLDGVPASDEQRIHAALLDAGGDAVLHGQSTLAWFGQRGFDLARLHVTRRRGTTSTPTTLAETHRLRDLEPIDVMVARGVPTVTPLRAIWSEAARYSNERWHERGLVRIGRILDDAHTAKLVTWAALHDSLRRLQRSGRAGTRLMRELAVERRPGSSPTESRNEDRFESILAGAGMEPMVRQCLVGGDAVIGRSDHRDRHLPLVVEVNSVAFHSTPTDRRTDEHRYASLVAARFTVVVVWEDDLWSRPRDVLLAVREGRARASRGDHAVIHSPGCPWPSDPARITMTRREPPNRG